jgi:hypothetical protein
VSETIPVFINDRVIQLTPGATVGDAVAGLGGEVAEQLAAGRAYATDGRGIRLASDAVLHAGAILRMVVSARREGAEADAHS